MATAQLHAANNNAPCISKSYRFKGTEPASSSLHIVAVGTAAVYGTRSNQLNPTEQARQLWPQPGSGGRVYHIAWNGSAGGVGVVRLIECEQLLGLCGQRIDVGCCAADAVCSPYDWLVLGNDRWICKQQVWPLQQTVWRPSNHMVPFIARSMIAAMKCHTVG